MIPDPARGELENLIVLVAKSLLVKAPKIASDLLEIHVDVVDCLTELVDVTECLRLDVYPLKDALERCRHSVHRWLVPELTAQQQRVLILDSGAGGGGNGARHGETW